MSTADQSFDLKAYETLRAQLALKGVRLTRTHPDDGPVQFLVYMPPDARGFVRSFATLWEVRGAYGSV